MKITIALLAIAALAGCASLQQTERTYSASYDSDNKSGTVSITLRPASPQVAATAPPAVYAMDDQTIERIVRLVEASAKRNAPTLTVPPAELPKP